MRQRPGAFSLVELMIVLAIVSVLAAFLLPTIERGLSSARAAGCANNLRQVAMATLSYAMQYAGCIPYYNTRGKTEPDGYPAFFMLIRNGDLDAAYRKISGVTYLESKLLLCPSGLEAIPTWPGEVPAMYWETAISRNGLAGKVALNYPASPRAEGTANANNGAIRRTITQYGVNGLEANAAPFTCDLIFSTNALVPMTRLSKIRNPSQCWLAGDAYESILTKPVYRHERDAVMIYFDSRVESLPAADIDYYYYGADFRVGDARQRVGP